MKILHLNSNYYYTKLHDLLIDHLNENNTENHVFMAYNKKNGHRYTSSNQVHSAAIINNIDRYLFFNKQRKTIKYVLEQYNLKEYELIHAHTLFTDGYTAYKLFKETRKEYIVTVRNTDLNFFFKYRWNLRKVGIDILRNAKKIIFLSETYKETLLGSYVKQLTDKEIITKKSIVIPNGIDPFWLKNKYKKHNVHSNDKKNLKFLFVGEINKNKNVVTVVDAMKLMRDKGYTVHLTVVGKVTDEKIGKFLERSTGVEMRGRLNKEDLVQVYRESDIFIMPSKSESFGLVYAESMSQGTPVIYTKGQGFDKQFPNGEVGYSVRHNESVDIINSVVGICNSYSAFSTKCFDNTEKFSWRSISAQIQEVYNSPL